MYRILIDQLQATSIGHAGVIDNGIQNKGRIGQGVYLRRLRQINGPHQMRDIAATFCRA